MKLSKYIFQNLDPAKTKILEVKFRFYIKCFDPSFGPKSFTDKNIKAPNVTLKKLMLRNEFFIVNIINYSFHLKLT